MRAASRRERAATPQRGEGWLPGTYAKPADRRLVGCSGWLASACWASAGRALAGRWQGLGRALAREHGLAARGVGSHRSSASSHARKHTTVQAYASARSPAAVRMAAALPLSIGAIVAALDRPRRAGGRGFR